MLGRDLMARLMTFHDVTGRDMDAFDIASETDCRRMVAESSPEIVINTAAYTNVDGCEKEQEKCFAVNALGVRNIALACRDRRIPIVHFSTDYIFDGRKKTPYVEEDLPAPLSVYGTSKLEGERFLQALSDNYLLVRTEWLYGSHGRNFVNAILEKAATVGSLEVVDDQIGSPTATRDLADAVALLMEGGHRGVFHITSRGRCSWYEFACTILKYTGIEEVTVQPITSDQLVQPAARPAWSVLSCRKFSTAVGKAMPTWRIALRRHIERTGLRK